MLETRTLTIHNHLLELIQCPQGEFLMGSNSGLPLEIPIRNVRIQKPFWLSKTLVTEKLWASLFNEPTTASETVETRPKTNVSHDDAVKFCDLASVQTGCHFSLPSEAQWEYACRAGTESEFFWGEKPRHAQLYGWFDSNSQSHTQPICQLEPNPWGFYDIVGNLWEWCADVWNSDYHDAPKDEVPWSTNAHRQTRRCLRGGAWDMDVFRLRSAYRSYEHKELKTDRFGIRVVVTFSPDCNCQMHDNS